MTCREGPCLPDWGDGMLTEYDRWINFSSEGPYQLSPMEFEFRYNTQPDIVDWIMSCSHDSEIRINPQGYLARIQFARKDGAMDFKLRWC